MGMREFKFVKTLSVLLSLGLLLAAQQLSNRLQRADALPASRGPAKATLRTTDLEQHTDASPNALNKNPRINFYE
jgi:hypothetical protein